MRDPSYKLLTLTQAQPWRQSLRSHGDVLIVTNGCFDVLTPGHVSFLKAARNLDSHSALLVLLNSDDSIRRLKGFTRPIWNQEERSLVLASLTMVNVVIPFFNIHCAEELRILNPDIYVKGADYTFSSLNEIEKKVLIDLGIRIEFIPYDSRYSSTKLIEAVKQCQ